MAKKNRARTDQITDVACVIHSTGYDWCYVERLWAMACRHLPGGVRFHVYTEHDRSVPPHMIKHCLTEWPGLAGPKKSWWYKLQLFDGRHHRGSLLYLDLDVVLVRDLSWVRALDTNYVWGIRDFRHLQRPGLGGMNSSMMWFDTQKFGWIWDNVARLDIMEVARRHRGGDQEYIYTQLDVNQRRFFEDRYFQSYRWQVQDGGYDFARRQHLRPGSGTAIAADTAVIVFHGHPKPHEVTDPQIQQLWNPVDQ